MERGRRVSPGGDEDARNWYFAVLASLQCKVVKGSVVFGWARNVLEAGV